MMRRRPLCASFLRHTCLSGQGALTGLGVAQGGVRVRDRCVTGGAGTHCAHAYRGMRKHSFRSGRRQVQHEQTSHARLEYTVDPLGALAQVICRVAQPGQLVAAHPGRNLGRL